MNQLKKIFNAGRVRRWHNHPEMSCYDDYNDAHQGRTARILLALHPRPSAILLAAALTHDDGELLAGDMTRDTKNANPELREMVRKVEEQGYRDVWGVEGPNGLLSERDKCWLKFADRLDAYMWMRHKQPGLRFENCWILEAAQIRKESDALGLDPTEIERVLK